MPPHQERSCLAIAPLIALATEPCKLPGPVYSVHRETRRQRLLRTSCYEPVDQGGAASLSRGSRHRHEGRCNTPPLEIIPKRTSARAACWEAHQSLPPACGRVDGWV